MLSSIRQAPVLAGSLLALALMGCTTALAITGHISGTDALVAFGLVGGAATGVTGAHVGGTVAANAAAVPVATPNVASAAPLASAGRPSVASAPAAPTTAPAPAQETSA